MESFTRLSPSKTAIMRRGIFMRCSTAVAAMASGGETIAPRISAAAQGSLGINECATQATATVVVSTSPKACSAIGRRFRRKSRHDVKNAAR
jgi:hypothetical protein